MGANVTKDQKGAMATGVITAVLSALILSGILGGISLGRSDAAQDQRLSELQRITESLKARMDRDGARSEQQMQDIRVTIASVETKIRDDIRELRTMIKDCIAQEKTK